MITSDLRKEKSKQQIQNSSISGKLIISSVQGIFTSTGWLVWTVSTRLRRIVFGIVTLYFYIFFTRVKDLGGSEKRFSSLQVINI